MRLREGPIIATAVLALTAGMLLAPATVLAQRTGHVAVHTAIEGKAPAKTRASQYAAYAPPVAYMKSEG